MVNSEPSGLLRVWGPGAVAGFALVVLEPLSDTLPGPYNQTLHYSV